MTAAVTRRENLTAEDALIHWLLDWLLRERGGRGAEHKEAICMLGNEEITNRFTYHPPSAEGVARHGTLTAAFIHLAELVDRVCLATALEANPSTGDRRKCRGCGALIEFLRGPSGATIPAQRVKTVYYQTAHAALAKVVPIETPLYVSHFETCPVHELFTRKKEAR